MADVVIECSGASKSIALGLDLLKPLGRYVLAGRTGFQLVPFITDKIVVKELKVFGGYGQSWNVEQAVKLINSRRYPIEKMVTQVFPLEKAEIAMNFFIENPQECIRIALAPYQ